MKKHIRVTSNNIKDVAEELMMDPKDLTIQYMQAQLKGRTLVFEVEEKESKPAMSFADRFNEDISED